MTCLDDETIVGLLDGAGVADRGELVQHLDTCASCRRLVADASANADDTLRAGAMIDRYTVTSVLGMGGMGVVYAAHDGQLQRDVAIKVLRDELLAEHPGDARAWLLREARTLARLSHPNVIAIHDADVDHDRVFIVMELVDGDTLRSWLAAGTRSWPEIRDVFVQAGRGLAAAHAAGLVHRDLKPDNLLVGRDGRVRVTDFGLAREPRQVTGAESSHTVTALGGTPAYMAPEQLAGGRGDQRSDVYAFCVTLYEAIWGERPRIPLDRLPAGRGVPAAVRRAILRGLRADPEARTRSIDDVVAVLARRRRAAPWLVAASAVSVAVAVAAIELRGEPVATRCSGADAWGTGWSPAIAERTRLAFAATGDPAAARSFIELDRVVAQYRGDWIAAYDVACHEALPPPAAARRTTCLEAARDHAQGFAATLADAVASYPSLVTGSIGQARALTPVADCLGARDDAISSKRIAPLHGIVAGADRRGLVDVFALDASGRPWHVVETALDHWSAWQPLGGDIRARELAVMRGDDRRLGVLAITADRGVMAIGEDDHGGWADARWSRIRTAADHATAVLDPDRRLRIYAVDGGGVFELAQDHPNDGFGEWTRVPAPAAASSIVAIPDRSLHLFGIAGGRAWELARTGDGWREPAWLPDGDPLIALDAGRSGDGTIHVIGVDRAHRAQRTRLVTPAEPWTPLGGPEEIAVLHVTHRDREPGQLNATIATTSHRLLQLYQWDDHRGWNRWWERLVGDAPLDGVVDLVQVRDDRGNAYVAVVTLTGEIWVWRFDGGTNHGFDLL
jgi:hypothetical protein